MVRTLQTTRVNTSYAPQPRQIPVYPVVVKEVPADLPPIRVENVINLEDSSEEQLPTPTPLAVPGLRSWVIDVSIVCTSLPSTCTWRRRPRRLRKR
jgi:hypothetical protein